MRFLFNISVRVLILIFGLAIVVVDAPAASKKNRQEIEYNSRTPLNKKPRWKSSQNPSTGLYTLRNMNVANGVSFNANVLYYYGDIAIVL